MPVPQRIFQKSKTSTASSRLRKGDHVQISCHCSMPDDLPMGTVHRIISQMEAAFLRVRPEVDRLLIHPEPVTDNDR